MGDDVDLYPEPEETLRRMLEALQDRLVVEREDVKRFRSIEADRAKGLKELLGRASEQAEMTASLIRDYRLALKRVKS